jgi:hypothetical protein
VVVPHGCGWGHPPHDYPRWDQERVYASIMSMMRKGKLTAPGLIRPMVSFEESPRLFGLYLVLFHQYYQEVLPACHGTLLSGNG